MLTEHILELDYSIYLEDPSFNIDKFNYKLNNNNFNIKLEDFYYTYKILNIK